MTEYDTLFKEIHYEYNTRVFHDDTTERKVLLARKYSFWLIHETIIKYAILKEQITAYKNKAKMEILKVPKKIISKYGAVSNECCLSMVKNLSKISKANISISITGVAGPNGGTKLKPVGLVYIGIKKGNNINIQKNLFNNRNRISIQKATTLKVLKAVLSLK